MKALGILKWIIGFNEIDLKQCNQGIAVAVEDSSVVTCKYCEQMYLEYLLHISSREVRDGSTIRKMWSFWKNYFKLDVNQQNEKSAYTRTS